MKKLELFFLFVLFVFAIYSAIIISQTTVRTGAARDNHLVLLAQQFSQGHLNLSPLGLPQGDYVDYFGKQFLYFGPLPSIILVPFAILYGRTFPQGYLGFGTLILSFIAIWLLCRRVGFKIVDSLWLAIFFVFSTVLFALGIIDISAFQVQALGVVFVLFALVEHFGKRRSLLIGTLIALAGLTRVTLYLSIIFFLWPRQKVVLLLFPIIISLVVLGGYNYKRFHSVFENGYRQNVTLGRYPMSANLSFGQFSLRHLPANLYSFLIKSPDPIVENGGGFVLRFPYLKVDPWGIAIWFTSPLFLLIFKAKKNSNFLPAFFTSIALMMPSLLYFGIGFSQFGYRYTLDFLPFLFLILASALKPSLSILAKVLIVIGVIFNCIYIASIWGYYPHFGIY